MVCFLGKCSSWMDARSCGRTRRGQERFWASLCSHEEGGSGRSGRSNPCLEARPGEDRQPQPVHAVPSARWPADPPANDSAPPVTTGCGRYNSPAKLNRPRQQHGTGSSPACPRGGCPRRNRWRSCSPRRPCLQWTVAERSQKRRAQYKGCANADRRCAATSAHPTPSRLSPLGIHQMRAPSYHDVNTTKHLRALLPPAVQLQQQAAIHAGVDQVSPLDAGAAHGAGGQQRGGQTQVVPGWEGIVGRRGAVVGRLRGRGWQGVRGGGVAGGPRGHRGQELPAQPRPQPTCCPCGCCLAAGKWQTSWAAHSHPWLVAARQLKAPF